MKKLCDRCGKREATCLFRQVINGKETKQSLCADCAATVGMPDLFGSFFGVSEPRQTQPAKRCDLCGSSFREIAESGKVGCPRCYEIFREELEATIRRIHGDAAYKGEAETPQKKEESPLSRLESAKRRLKEAVEREDYEQAALLRDEIRSLSEGGVANA